MLKMTNTKMLFKASISVLIAAAMTFPSFAAEVNITVDGESISEASARLIGGTTYVPLDEFAEIMLPQDGECADIDAEAGENYIEANGRAIYNPSPVIEDDTLYVPIRSLAAALGADIAWEGGTKTVSVGRGASAIEDAGDYYSSDQLYWLSRIISAESRGESLEGQIAVGSVILNRVRSGEFPDTIYNVIFDRRWGVQFTPTANGAIYSKPYDISVTAAKICLEGYITDESILYFIEQSAATNLWVPNNRPYVLSIGCHDFYS
ncbi:MAG: cell wall hydrolase [Eubacteriales bacterium]